MYMRKIVFLLILTAGCKQVTEQSELMTSDEIKTRDNKSFSFK